jgi:hypothetical protein
MVIKNRARGIRKQHKLKLVLKDIFGIIEKISDINIKNTDIDIIIAFISLFITIYISLSN